VWLLIIGMLLIVISTLAIIQVKCPNLFFVYVMGRNKSNPYLNVLIAIVGGSQNKLPITTFTRFLLAMFLIYCFIMRNLYLGALFKIMKSDIYINEIKTIDDINELDYFYYIYEGLSYRVKDLSFLKR